MIPPLSPPAADVVVVGGGPIGLWTAIQTKFLTQKEVVILEKHPQYRRADIRLNIEASSLQGIPNCPPLQALAADWGARKTVPIKEMEDSLERVAHELGIRIIKGEAADPTRLQEQFPEAQVFIGADGARSQMRAHFFEDEYQFNTPLQYLAQVQYRIQLPDSEAARSSYRDSYIKQKFAGHLIFQTIRPKEGYAEVTLQVFIDKATYDAMDDATFGSPYYFERDLYHVPDDLRHTLVRWWGAHEEQKILTDEQGKNKVTVIQLATYAADQFYKEEPKEGALEGRVVIALVGDAAQGHPFFRAINNGFLTATKLASCIGKAFANQNSAPLDQSAEKRAREFASYFPAYARYSTWRAWVERIKALAKNLFLSFSQLWIKMSGQVPWEVVKLDQDQRGLYYARGIDLWQNLTGKDYPPEGDEGAVEATPT